MPPFSQLSDFAYYGTSGNSDTLLYYYNDSALTGTCWVVRALAVWGHVRALAGVGRQSLPWEMGRLERGVPIVSLGRWSPCPTLAYYVGLLTLSLDHPERIKWRGVLPHSTPSLHSWPALRDVQELHGRSSWVRRVCVTPA